MFKITHVQVSHAAFDGEPLNCSWSHGRLQRPWLQLQKPLRTAAGSEDAAKHAHGV